MTDFFGKKPSAADAAKKPTARKPSGSKPAPVKKPPSKKRVESDDDDEIGMGEAVAARNPAPRRAATAKTKQYIEIDSGSDDDNDEMFEDD